MTGYRTVSLSKVFHHQDDCPESWDVNWRPDEGNGTWRNYIEEDNLVSERHGIIWSTESADVKDNAYFDGQTAEMAIAQLKDLRKRDTPFFMAVGFLKPHLPFNAPKKYWDLYDEKEIRLPPNYHLMNGSIPSKAFHTWGELRAYEDIPDKGQGPVPDNYARHLIHGYRACVSYTDAQIGKVLAALELLGMSDDTIIILFGDHGWSLGEHGEWCKHSTMGKVSNPCCMKGQKDGKMWPLSNGTEVSQRLRRIMAIPYGLTGPANLWSRCCTTTLPTGRRTIILPACRNQRILSLICNALSANTDIKG